MKARPASSLADVAAYYSAKLAKHGDTSRGVDWNGDESQLLRFEQLSKIIDNPEDFSINDVGCGYGALLDYLNSRCRRFIYNGCDVSGDMIRAAQVRHISSSTVRFLVTTNPPEIADYGIASGIFNVKLKHDNAEWKSHLETTLDILNLTSRRGFAFNCLTSYSDADKMQDHLYYAEPCDLFDLCKRRYARHVALLHDYGLYEFTILVRKHP